MSMLTAIETDLHDVYVTLTDDAKNAIHSVLAHHTKVANVAVHLANDLQEFAASTAGNTIEGLAGLSASQRAIVNGVAEHVAEWVKDEAQPAA